MTKIEIFEGYDTHKLSKQINTWIASNHIEVISTNTSISSYGVEGTYIHIVVTVLYKCSKE